MQKSQPARVLKGGFLLLILMGSMAWSDPLSLLKSGENCVAYLAKERWFFVKTNFVVGKSCEVSAQVIPEVGGKYHVEVEFPTASITSGVAERDKEVHRLLKVKSQSVMRLRSESFALDEWVELKRKRRFKLRGEIDLAQGPRSIEAQIELVEGPKGFEIDGVVRTSFSGLGLKQPKLAGGFFVEIRPDLELHFRLSARRMLGAGLFFN